MKTIKLKHLTSSALVVAKLRSPIHRPTQNHRSKTAYNRRDRSWKND